LDPRYSFDLLCDEVSVTSEGKKPIPTFSKPTKPELGEPDRERPETALYVPAPVGRDPFYPLAEPQDSSDNQGSGVWTPIQIVAVKPASEDPSNPGIIPSKYSPSGQESTYDQGVMKNGVLYVGSYDDVAAWSAANPDYVVVVAPTEKFLPSTYLPTDYADDKVGVTYSVFLAQPSGLGVTPLSSTPGSTSGRVSAPDNDTSFGSAHPEVQEPADSSPAQHGQGYGHGGVQVPL